MASSAGAVGHVVRHHPLAVQRDRVALGHPFLLFRLRPVVRACDVADVVPVVAVGDALEERGAVALARAVDVLRRHRVYTSRTFWPSIVSFGHAEGRGARQALRPPSTPRNACIRCSRCSRTRRSRAASRAAPGSSLRRADPGRARLRRRNRPRLDRSSCTSRQTRRPSRCRRCRRRWRWRRGCRYRGRQCASSRPCPCSSRLPCRAVPQTCGQATRPSPDSGRGRDACS